jgi:hypothetical protein
LRRRAFGQSLVEFAVALPILLFIVAGIVEVGNIFVQRNRAALVGRETTRFVATGGSDTDALIISEQTVQQAFGGEVIAFDEDHMDIYVIHATVSADGSAIIDDGDLDDCSSEDDFCETHIYPTQEYYDDNFGGVDQAPHSGWESADIYARLSQDDVLPDADLEDLKVVATVVQYNTTTIINLPIFPQTEGGIPLNEITIMRQEATIAEAAGSPTQGCSAYPIVVGADALTGASQGDEITLPYGTGLTNFNYLLWNTDDLSGGKGARLEASLGGDQEAVGDPPVGNAKDATFGYINPSDPSDTFIHKTNPVLLNDAPTSGGDAMSMMNDHITDERVIRILEFDTYNAGTFTISGVIIAELKSLDNLTGTLVLEFVRRDNSCGN